MNFEVDEPRLLYGLGALLGIFSIIYFGQQLIFELSPTIKSFILLVSSLMFLAAAEYSEHETLVSSLYFFTSFSYLSFLVYIFTRFNFSRETVFVSLAASSALFISLGYLKSERNLEIDPEKSRTLVMTLLLVIVVAVLFDVTGSQPEHSIELKESVKVDKPGSINVGSITVRNDFVFSRNLDIPEYSGCIYRSAENRRGLYFSAESRNLIKGDKEVKYNLTEEVGWHENDSLAGNYTVYNSECPENPEQNSIYVSRSVEERQVLRAD
ncbi:MAG: hypothetical protein ABEJ56_04490 [Candidatus Nanohaloarchaea archaeon]